VNNSLFGQPRQSTIFLKHSTDSGEPDFKFVVIEKFLSVENEFSLREGLLLNTYFFLKRLGQSDEAAFGLDKSDVAVEQIPLVYQPFQKWN
jgi:KUP system potassium uptake protein